MITTSSLRMVISAMYLGAISSFFSSCGNEEGPKTIPTVVTSTTFTDVTTTSAKGGGEITQNGSATILESGLVYNDIVSEPTLSDDKVVATVTSGGFTALMDGLSSGKTYFVRAYATNEAGTAYGAVAELTTGNAPPTATNLKIIGSAVVGNVLTASYKYNDAEGDLESGTSIQWYQADAVDGTHETAIADATLATFTVLQAQSGKYIRVGVTPKAATGTVLGIEVKSIFKDGEPETITFSYMNSPVTYGILVSAKTGRKWMDRNLGATAVPTSATDFASYGDLFQWGRRADRHQTIIRTGDTDDKASGATGNTSTVAPFDYALDNDAPTTDKFIVIDQVIPFDWRKPSNDDLWKSPARTNCPCPSGWHIPTRDEWSAEGLIDINDAFSKLNITKSGLRYCAEGSFYSSSETGYYWSSSTTDSPISHYSIRIQFNNIAVKSEGEARGYGMSVRCIKDL